MKKMTHIGMEVETVYTQGMKIKRKLRETEKYYVSKHGTKYRKDNGSIVGERFTTFKLDISTVKTL